MQIVVVALIAWLVRVATYFAALLFVYGERVAWSGDAEAVLFWTALVFSVLSFILCIPVLRGTKRMLRGIRPLWPLPLAAGGLGVIEYARDR
jgi:hypothetical protein